MALMLTALGLPFLRWLDEEVLPEAVEMLDDFWQYVGRWRYMLEGEEEWPND